MSTDNLYNAGDMEILNRALEVRITKLNLIKDDNFDTSIFSDLDFICD